MFQRSPEFAIIIPTISIVFDRGDIAIAQASQIQQTQQTPPPSAIDPVAAFGYVIAVSVTGFAFLPKIIEKWFSGAIATKEKKESIEIQQDKERADFYLKEADKKSVLFDEVFKTMLANVLQSSAENKEIYYGLMKLIEALTERITALEQSQINSTEQTQRGFTSLVARINDVTNLLKAKDRSGD